MFWEEDKSSEPPEIGDDVVDLVFGTDCRALPVDHAYDLARAIQQRLPWLVDEPCAAIHTLHGAASGNGWVRPEDPDALILFSRRSKFMLRVPNHRIDDALALQGVTLDVNGHALGLKMATQRPLSVLTTLFSRFLATALAQDDEEAIMTWAVEQLKQLDIHPRKMLCGTTHRIKTPQGDVLTRSLMIADLEYDESLRLQQQGIGPHRLLGCGLFIPHKGIQTLNSE